MPVRLFNVIGAAMVIAVAAFSFYLYFQHRAAVEELKAGIGELKEGLKGQSVEFDKFRQENEQARALIPQIKDSIVEIKSVIAQSRVEALMIKDDAAQWKKDYVAVLIELEERLNKMDEVLKGFQEQWPKGSLEKIQQQLDTLSLQPRSDPDPKK